MNVWYILENYHKSHGYGGEQVKNIKRIALYQD